MVWSIVASTQNKELHKVITVDPQHSLLLAIRKRVSSCHVIHHLTSKVVYVIVLLVYVLFVNLFVSLLVKIGW